MARLSSVLWLLGLMMTCFCNSQSNRNQIKIKMISAHIQISENVELECVSNTDAGIYWIHQNTANTPQSIAYVSIRGVVSALRNSVDFRPTKSGTVYRLTVNNFKKETEGIYYCATHQGQALIFSQSLQVYLPVTTTTPTTTTQGRTTPPQATKEPMEGDPSTSDEKLSDNGLKFSCAQYIWIPLAGGCFLLLIILVITFAICCDPRRRRRTCRCHRPMNGTNGKHRLPH